MMVPAGPGRRMVGDTYAMLLVTPVYAARNSGYLAQVAIAWIVADQVFEDFDVPVELLAVSFMYGCHLAASLSEARQSTLDGVV